MHSLPPSLFDGNNFNTSPPIAACAVSHALAWRMQRQQRALLVMEDDVNMVLDVRDRVDLLRERALQVGAKLLMLAPGETFEEDTVTSAIDDDGSNDDDGVRVLREKMTLYAQVQRRAGQLLVPSLTCVLLRRATCWRRVRGSSCCSCCGAA
jgi:hypothetical protein